MLARSPRRSGRFVGVRLHDDFDPRRLLGDLEANSVCVSYERPDRDFALVGVGEAGRVEAGAGVDARSLQAQAARLLAHDAEIDEPALRPRLLGGFAFDASRTPGGPWTGFAPGALVLPRLLFVRDGGVSGVVVAPGVDPGEVEALLGCRVDAPSTAQPLSVAEDLDAECWLGAVERLAAEVRAGAYEKVVLAARRELRAAAPMAIGAALSRLRACYPDCHVFSFSTSAAGGATFLGASPELLVSLRGGVVSALGLAGSKRRSPDAAEDGRLGAALLGSAKDRIEHEIVVRALREGLAPLTEQLRAPNQPTLLRLRNIQHLATEVRARALPGVDVLTLVQLLHPTPAVCGWPTPAASAVIATHEPFDRGWYAGPIGWVDAAGEGEFAVALRSALVRGPRAWLFAGAGIMGDSRPEDELAEIELKLSPLADALSGGSA